MRIRGTTALLAHIGFPTQDFKSPLIYNPYFEHAGIDAVLVPMGCQAEHFPRLLAAVFTLTNIRGALITMPHKMAAAALVDEASPRRAHRRFVQCRAADGRTAACYGDLFDGEGFVRALTRKGCRIDGARALVVGAGGVGSAIAASLAAAGSRALALFDIATRACAGVGAIAWRRSIRAFELTIDSNDPAGQDIVVNATPMGTR